MEDREVRRGVTAVVIRPVTTPTIDESNEPVIWVRASLTDGTRLAQLAELVVVLAEDVVVEELDKEEEGAVVVAIEEDDDEDDALVVGNTLLVWVTVAVIVGIGVGVVLQTWKSVQKMLETNESTPVSDAA